MSNKCLQDESHGMALKNESARQRWELFHRAIAHAKQSNANDMQNTESDAGESKHPGPVLSIAR